MPPEGQRAGIRDKDRRQRMKEERKGTRERGQGSVPEDKGLPQGREETDATHRQWWFIKVQGETPLGWGI